MIHYQRLTLVISAIAVSLSFIGCDSTSTDTQSYNVLASSPIKSVYHSPTPKIKISGEESVADFGKDLAVPLSSISAPTRGSDRTPFTFEQRFTDSSGVEITGDFTVYPPDNSTANLIFYKGVGLPLLKIEQLDDDFVRIWLRVRNLKENDIFVNVRCEGSDSYGRTDEQYNYDSVIFQEDIFRDFTFVLKGAVSKKFSIVVTESGKRR